MRLSEGFQWLSWTQVFLFFLFFLLFFLNFSLHTRTHMKSSPHPSRWAGWTECEKNMEMNEAVCSQQRFTFFFSRSHKLKLMDMGWRCFGWLHFDLQIEPMEHGQHRIQICYRNINIVRTIPYHRRHHHQYNHPTPVPPHSPPSPLSLRVPPQLRTRTIY